MEIALYVRVSTTRQQHTQTIAQQVARLREYVAMQPDWHLAEEHIYRDDGYSGASFSAQGWIGCGTGPLWRRLNRCSSRLQIAWPVTTCINCS